MIYNNIFVVSTVLIFGLGGIGYAEDSEPERETSVWHDVDEGFTHYYRGTIGNGLAIQLMLAIPDEDTEGEEEEREPIRAYYLYERHGKAIPLEGKIIDETVDTPRFHFIEQASGKQVTGRLDFQWQDPAGVNVEGEWSSPDRKKQLSIKLKLVAIASQTEMSSARCSLELRAPLFLGKGALATAANTTVKRLRGESVKEYKEWETQVLADMIDEADDDFDYPGLPYTSSSHITPVYCGSDVVSLSVFDWSYAGGAHPNHWYESATVACDHKGKYRELALPDLFSAGTPWKKVVGNKLAARLQAQDALREGCRRRQDGA